MPVALISTRGPFRQPTVFQQQVEGSLSAGAKSAPLVRPQMLRHENTGVARLSGECSSQGCALTSAALGPPKASKKVRPLDLYLAGNLATSQRFWFSSPSLFPKRKKFLQPRGTNLYTVGAGLIACPQTRVGLFLKGPYEKKYWRPLLEVAGGPQSCFQKSLSRRGILWVRTLPSRL